MGQILVPGQNCPLPEGILEIECKSGAPADFSAFRLYGNGKIQRDEDFVFYGQRITPDASIQLVFDATSATFRVNPDGLSAEKIMFCVTSDFPALAALGALSLNVRHGSESAAICNVDTNGRDERALIIGELYKRNGQWKFRFVCQGFRGGLKPLAEYFGVEIADAPEKAAPPPVPAQGSQPAGRAAAESGPAPKPETPKINLSKVVLTKSAPSIDLKKHDLSGGVYKVNLNWNQAPAVPTRGLARLFSRNKGIDLDLGAYIRLKNGKQTIVQALGEMFGNLDRFPYVKLMGDDRTGAAAEGEWLYINGDMMNKIEEIVIYTFIYSGVPNWSATDGVVRLKIPGQPEIETRLTGSSNSLAMCAIARIVNEDGNLRVERLDRYFEDHVEMDHAFHWGFRWSAGTK